MINLVREVRTPAGEAFFHEPIGTPISEGEYAKILAGRREARAKYEKGHPERLKAERAVRQARKVRKAAGISDTEEPETEEAVDPVVAYARAAAQRIRDQTPVHDYKVGDQVETDLSDGGWIPGEVTSAIGNEIYTRTHRGHVLTEIIAPSSRIRRPDPRLTHEQALDKLTRNLFGDEYAEELLRHARWNDDKPHVLNRSDVGKISITHKPDYDFAPRGSYTIERGPYDQSNPDDDTRMLINRTRGTLQTQRSREDRTLQVHGEDANGNVMHLVKQDPMADEDANSVKYTGDRSATRLLQFIKEHHGKAWRHSGNADDESDEESTLVPINHYRVVSDNGQNEYYEPGTARALTEPSFKRKHPSEFTSSSVLSEEEDDWAGSVLPVELSAKTAALEVTPAPIGKPNGPGLWFVKGMQMPPYFQNVRNALIRSGHDVGSASAITWGAMRRWAVGGGNVHPEVRDAARKTLASLKVKEGIAHATTEHANNELIAIELAWKGLGRGKGWAWVGAPKLATQTSADAARLLSSVKAETTAVKLPTVPPGSSAHVKAHDTASRDAKAKIAVSRLNSGDIVKATHTWGTHTATITRVHPDGTVVATIHHPKYGNIAGVTLKSDEVRKVRTSSAAEGTRKTKASTSSATKSPKVSAQKTSLAYSAMQEVGKKVHQQAVGTTVSYSNGYSVLRNTVGWVLLHHGAIVIRTSEPFKISNEIVNSQVNS
jgi:hypothetical protein